jgi:NADH-quinone oxidoreductase subunit C
MSDPRAAAETVPAGPLVERLQESLVRLGGRSGLFKGMVTVTMPRAGLHDGVRSAKEAGFDLLSDVLGIDWLTFPRHAGPRFSVVYNLYAIAPGERVFLRVDVEDGEAVPTVTDLWPGANFLEREVYDLFGIVFTGHPNLRKLVTPEDLEGHALRKDFPLGETPTLFNDGRFLDPAAFRAGMIGKSRGLTGWVGGARKGVISEQVEPPRVAPPERARPEAPSGATAAAPSGAPPSAPTSASPSVPAVTPPGDREPST